MDLKTLNQYYDDGWLVKQTHPRLPLTIWNYSIATQFEGKWDEITLQCRGLVTDHKGNVVARPFRKFFNIEEGRYTPTSQFEVYEKMDGSLGIFFYYEGNPIFATRGSFTSDQAIKGREILEKYNWKNGTYEGYTYLFEIIYKENRIVVDYGGMEELIVLGVIETFTGKEVEYEMMESEGFKIVKKYNGISDYSALKNMVKDDAEGFVVKFSNGDRIKIKGEEYFRLHKIMTNLSTTSVWEVLSNNGSLIDLLKDVPDEFYNKVKEYESELIKKFKGIEYRYRWFFMLMPKNDRKKFANSAKQVEYPSILFTLLDDKDISPIIWKIIKPKFEKL